MSEARIEAWEAGGALERVDSQTLFVRRSKGAGPLLLFLHGFPSSSYDFAALLDRRRGRATLAFDMLGFGLSAKPRDHVYSLGWQADAAESLVRRAGRPPTFVVAHDMGTSVATELMARDLAGTLGFPLAGALLFNGSILLDRASPTLGQRVLRSRGGALFARLTTAFTFRRQFARLFSSAHPLSPEQAADQWALLSRERGHRLLHRTIHYMDERERLTERWHGAFRDWPGALSLAWGLRDPVATTHVLAGLRELRPEVPVTELADVGHYPQLEAPARMAAALDEAIARAGAEGV